MDFGRLKSVVRDAALLNVGYYASIVDLSRDYLKSLRHVLGEGGVAPAPPQQRDEAPSPASPPLVIAARAGETAEGAFAIVNQLQHPAVAAIEVSGDIDASKVRLTPQGATLAPGEQRVVRIAVEIDRSTQVGRDRQASIAIPGLGSRSIPLVLRRLPDEPAADKPAVRAAKTARRKSR